MARLMDPTPPGQPEPGDPGEVEGSAEFGYACLMALRLRASQRQVLWEVMVSLLDSEKEG